LLLYAAEIRSHGVGAQARDGRATGCFSAATAVWIGVVT
jgi:hypothetical protein